MAVRKIRAKQRGPYCDYCSPKTSRATWRGFMWGKHSCDDHLDDLRAWDARESTPDYSDAQFYAGY